MCTCIYKLITTTRPVTALMILIIDVISNIVYFVVDKVVIKVTKGGNVKGIYVAFSEQKATKYEIIY